MPIKVIREFQYTEYLIVDTDCEKEAKELADQDCDGWTRVYDDILIDEDFEYVEDYE